MAEGKLDVIIIGGGITGAGIALDAASRGLKVGLVEKQDFSAGTSSRSTKLVHGGLRYLKQGEIKLVREVGRERAILHQNAPHIVIPEKMLLPLVDNGTYGKMATSVGLWLYDRLAGVKQEERRVMLSKKQTEELEPLLRKDILRGGGLYIEYRTDDARLTIEVMKTAHSYGALCVNYAEVSQFIYKDRKVIGVQVKDQLTSKIYEIYTKKIVNAAGPWVDQLRDMDGSLEGKRLHLTKGVHLVVPYHRLPLKQSVYFDVPDGRMIFAIPRESSTYIGTTDTNYHGNIEKPTVSKEDVDYLLSAVNHMFPNAKLKIGDISSSWAGLRPLIHEDGKSPSELSRKDEIFYSSSGLITIAGGKLTGFRKMAERVVDIVMSQLKEEYGFKYKPCITDKIVLSGGDFTSSLQEYINERIDMAKLSGLNEKHVVSLVYRYGTNTLKVLEKAEKLKQGLDFNQSIHNTDILVAVAEMHYAIEEEMVANLNDFLIRRTGRLFFERDNLASYYKILLEEMARIFGWTQQMKQTYLDEFEEEYKQVVEFNHEANHV
ncbi:glycerol-3-phosphate dehydrogenase/oxidase [Microaerobacter geothermalis]|nr:glycerol-3-phosphate dehydrogenase/oxidase [Microaerobacter geothermalis]MCF6094729.1 glycerol-3-phosphate dehydrogenase/oxidase [Microaerobacter geothermalis]